MFQCLDSLHLPRRISTILHPVLVPDRIRWPRHADPSCESFSLRGKTKRVTKNVKKKEKEKEKERNRFLRFLFLIKSAIIREFHFCTFSKRELARLASSAGCRRAEEARVDNEVDPTPVSLIVPSNFLSPRLEKNKMRR